MVSKRDLNIIRDVALRRIHVRFNTLKYAVEKEYQGKVNELYENILRKIQENPSEFIKLTSFQFKWGACNPVIGYEFIHDFKEEYNKFRELLKERDNKIAELQNERNDLVSKLESWYVSQLVKLATEKEIKLPDWLEELLS